MVGVTLPVNKETQDIVGKENIVSTFFAPYTYKMWGKTIEELDPSILKEYQYVMTTTNITFLMTNTKYCQRMVTPQYLKKY